MGTDTFFPVKMGTDTFSQASFFPEKVSVPFIGAF
jgi:hypothetical protein